MKVTTVDRCDGEPHALRVYEILDDDATCAVVARTIQEAVALYRAWREDAFGESASDWREPDGGVIRKYDEVIVKPNYRGPLSCEGDSPTNEHDWETSEEGDSRECKRCGREEICDEGLWGLP